MAVARTHLCHLDELGDPASRGFTVTVEDKLLDIFIVRRGHEVVGYLNSCPHTGGPLDWVPDQFLDLDKAYIQCATHAALFTIGDGRCIAGPCQGGSLTRIPLLLEAGEVLVEHRGFPVIQATAATRTPG